jgi:hypothetical protein
MTDIKWVPEWAEYFTIERTERGLEIKFVQIMPAGESYHHIDDLPAMLSRRDVGQQIRDKPLADRIVVSYPGREKPRNKYDREILPSVWVDVYDVLGAFTGTISSLVKPAIDHAIKKLLTPGLRGVKEERQDLVEARDSIDRAIQKLDEWA